MTSSPTIHDRIAAATQEVSGALSELQLALDVLSKEERADKRMITAALVTAFERLAVTEQNLKSLRDELEGGEKL
ncbi:MAG: hypothetical protein ACO1OB_21295 [Archangium sp.]